MVKNFTLITSISFLFIFLSSCDLVQEVVPVPLPLVGSEGQTFIIKQGQHNSNHLVEPVTKNKMRFLVKFDETARYANKTSNNQEDINKLYGFSDCSTQHHVNSARFGWRWFDSQLQIFAYTYKEGVRTSKFITAVALNKDYIYDLEVRGNKYVFQVNNKTLTMERGCNGFSAKYKLFPYFGGDEVAPHNIKIVIKDLDAS
jgi:hypothetical protein